MRRRITPLLLATLILPACDGSTAPVLRAPDGPSARKAAAGNVSVTGVPVTVLGPGHANAINARGQVVGWSLDENGDQIAVLWDDGEMIDLGAPVGLEALGINNRGQVVIGVSYPHSGPSDAYLWDRGELTLIVPDATVRGINARGQVVGFLRRDPPTDLGFIWEDGELTSLDPLPGNAASRGQGINAAGTAVGFSSWGNGGVLAQVWIRGETQPLETPEGHEGRALGINNAGLVVGRVELAGRIDQRGVLWQNGELVTLPVPDGASSRAQDINARGQSVGSVTRAGDVATAALWTKRHALVDLGRPVGDDYEGPTVASAINAAGVVVGGGGYDPHAYVWRP